MRPKHSWCCRILDQIFLSDTKLEQLKRPTDVCLQSAIIVCPFHLSIQEVDEAQQGLTYRIPFKPVSFFFYFCERHVVPFSCKISLLTQDRQCVLFNLKPSTEAPNGKGEILLPCGYKEGRKRGPRVSLLQCGLSHIRIICL